jgi:plastocyanin
MKVLRSLTIATLVAAAACGGGGASNSVTNPTGGNPTGGNPTGGDSPVATNAVAVGDNIFTPPNIQVNVGTTVTWTWSPNVASHNVTFGDGAKSPDQTTGTFTRTFSTAGTFNYSCTLHSGMSGSVKVQ